MSAIAGILRFDGRQADRRDIERMTNALQAYGPDRNGAHAAGPVGLGHVLMRMTAEDTFEAQPTRGASGAVMVGDLRLDNRDELIAALGLDPQRAFTAADSAIVLAAWEKWGNDAWARLRGPFAAAVWDQRNRRLTLARDPLGCRPLCYHLARDFIAFGTLPKALLALADVPRELNKEQLADFLISNHSDCEPTIYRDIVRLLPAHAMTVGADGAMSKVHYWKLENIRAVRLKSDQDYADGLHERLDVAVRRNLRTHHKVGCFLSGGLDSSSVAALAAAVLAQQGKRLPAYTQVPDESFHRPPGVRLYYDERPYVEAIAKMIDNLDVTYVRSGEQDDFAELDPLFFAFDGPIRNVTNMGWIMKILRLAKAENHRVLLGGEYGNATISWTGWGQAVDHLVRGRLWTAVKQWRLLYRISSRSPVGAFRQLFIEPLSASPIVAWARRPDEAAIKAQFASDMRVVERAKRDARRIRAPLGSFALTERLEMIAGVPARGEWDAAALALTGVECRDPTSDLDLLEYCFGIPDEQYLAEGIHRSLIRRAMWGRLPPKVLTNRRRGQQGADWFGKLSRNKERLASDVASLRSSKLAAEAIDIDRLDQLIQNLPETPTYKQTEALDYLVTVTRGVAAGRFLRLFEGKNR